MVRKYKFSIWHDEEKRWEDIEFEAESGGNEPKEKAIAIYKERNLNNNCFLYVWIPAGDPQFIRLWHNQWKGVSYFAAAYKDQFLKGE